MATQVGQTLSAEDFNKTYGVGTTVSPDEFNKIYGNSTPVAEQTKPSGLDKVLNFLVPQTVKYGKTVLKTPEMLSQWSTELKENGPLAAPSPELRELSGGSSTDTGNRFLNSALDAWKKTRESTGAGAEVGSLASMIKSIPTGIRNLLHPLKNTGGKLETVRSSIKVEPTDVDRGILDKLLNNPAKPKYVRTYNLGGKGLQKSVKSIVETISKDTTNLNDVYKNLEAIKENIPSNVYDVVSGAVRDYANPLQTKVGMELAKTYSRLKGLQKYEGTIKKSIIGTSAAAVIWTLRAKISKLLGN